MAVQVTELVELSRTMDVVHMLSWRHRLLPGNSQESVLSLCVFMHGLSKHGVVGQLVSFKGA